MINEEVSFLHQMGWGGLSMIPELIQQGIGRGVILSNKDVNWDRCQQFVSDIRAVSNDSSILFDPQLFEPRYNHERLEDYPHHISDYTTSDFSSDSRVRQDYIDALIETQTTLMVNYHLTPSVYLPHYSGTNLRMNLDLGNQYVDTLGEGYPNVYLSLPLHILNLENQEYFDDILNLVTASEFQCVYLIVELEEDQKFLWRNQVQIFTLLKFLHILVENEIEVILGYSSQSVIPLLVSGINSFASGHYLNLRSFTRDRWTTDESQRRAKDKYYSHVLLTNIEQDPDLELLYQRNRDGSFLRRIRSESSFDDALFIGNPPSTVQWRSNSWRHYLYYCQEITNLIKGNTRQARFQRALASLISADNLFTQLRKEGVQFHRLENDGSHLRSWLGALRAYNHDFIIS